MFGVDRLEFDFDAGVRDDVESRFVGHLSSCRNHPVPARTKRTYEDFESMMRVSCRLRMATIRGVVAAAVVAAGCPIPVAAAPPVANSLPTAVLTATTNDLPKTPSATIRVFSASLDPGAVTFWHVHPFSPIVYIESGTGTWEYRGGRAPDTRHAGQAIVEPANIAVRLVNRGTTPLRVVIFGATSPGVPFLHPAR